MPIVNPVIKGSGGSSSTSFGLTADEWSGHLVNGHIAFDANKTPDFTGYTGPTRSNELSSKFLYRTDIIGDVTFPDITTIDTGTTSYVYMEYIYQSIFAYSGINSVSFPNLTSIKKIHGILNNSFAYCNNLTKVEFPVLTEIVVSGSIDGNNYSGNYALNSLCYSAQNLTSFEMPKLRTITTQASAFGSAFNYCYKLKEFMLPALETVTTTSSYEGYVFGSTFNYAHIERFYLPRLTTVVNTYSNGNFMSSCFYGCGTYLKNVILGSLTTLTNAPNAFNSMLSSCTGVTVHFPVTAQSMIEALSSYSSGFGGTNTTILFDCVPANVTTGTNTDVWIGQDKLGYQESSFTAGVISGTMPVFAAKRNGTGWKFFSDSNDFSSTSSINLAIDTSTLYPITINTNVSGATYIFKRTQDTKVISFEGTSFSANYGTTGIITATKEGCIFDEVAVTFGSTSSVTLTAIELPYIQTFDYTTFPANWTVDSNHPDYWATDSTEGIITCHPTIATTLQTYAYMTIPIPAGITKITISGMYKVSSESNCDFGMAYVCKDTFVAPTSSSIPSGGTELFRNSGSMSDYVSYSREITNLGSSLILALTWGQDYSVMSGNHTLYVKPITVTME